MLPSASGRPARSSTLVELLDRAADRLTERLQAFCPAEGGFTQDEILDELDHLVDDVRATLGDRTVIPASQTSLRPQLQLQLATELTDEVVSMARDSGEIGSADVVAVVGALVRIRRAVYGGQAEDLRARLARPDAFQLLVEVAHDMRSPLTSILFLAETLRAGLSGEINDIQRTQLGLIYAAALGLTAVTSDIVDLARAERGLLGQEPEPYSPADVFHGVLDLVRPMAEEKGIELRLNVPEFDRFYGQPGAIQRILLNLSTNALKFTESGYVELGVRRRPRGEIEFYVRDTGRGISPERQEELFRPFKKRGERTGYIFSGSGVGLSIARRLVRALDSELELESAPEWGTRFSFTLRSPPRP